jgi:demethylmenaquinone methyltransferase / 2-methoxy-6-polyprenyl-1,4-benzoquinol methylase
VTRVSQIAERQTSVGARPEGTVGELQAAAHVRDMFGRIAPRYDVLNHALSLSLDIVWRRRVAIHFREVRQNPNARVLDICCGTGDLTMSLARGAEATVIGSDFAHPMLVLAAEKSRKRSRAGMKLRNLAGYIEADALDLPFADASFDLVTAAFGFRNLANYGQGLREMYRILRPEGQIGILEFAEPTGKLFGSVYRFYFGRILPYLGGIISGDRSAYEYLPASVGKFPSPAGLAELISVAGFADPDHQLWLGGAVTLHSAVKR